MVKQCWSNKVKYRAISTLFKVNRREHIPLRNLFYSARILQIKNIYNYELAKHVQNVSQYLPDYIINGFNISATTKIRETRQTSKWTNEIPLAETLNERRHTSFRGSTIWNDIPNDFILVNYFRFCRLYKKLFYLNIFTNYENFIFPLVCNCVTARLVCAYGVWLCLHRLCRYMHRIL